MNIVADANIPFVEESFGSLGTVRTVEGRKITRDTLKDATILLVRSVTRVDRALLEGTPVRFVASATIGTDHVDTAWLREQCIGFASAPGSNAQSVAQYVLRVLYELTKNGTRGLQKKTLGIVGVGNIGSVVMSMAGALNMPCLLNDPPKKRMTGSDTFVSLEEVLAHADIVTFHVPLEKGGNHPTYHMVNDQCLSAMKKGALLINTSRGGVVDETALKSKRTHLGGVVLDVWSNEPDIDEETLSVCTIATPHIAGYSYEGKVTGVDMIYRSACAYFFKEPQWSAQKVYAQQTRKKIDLGDSDDPIAQAVMQGYNPVSDDTSLRKITEKKGRERGLWFDSLRKNYPRRREFSFFDIVNSKKLDPETFTVLSRLGFSLK